MTISKSIKISAAFAVPVILAVSILVLKDDGRLQRQVNTHKLRQDSILAEKISLDKQVYQLEAGMGHFRHENALLESQVECLATEKEDAFSRITLLDKDIRMLRNVKAERNSFRDENTELKERLATTLHQFTALQNENTELQQRLTMLLTEHKTISVLSKVRLGAQNKRSKATVRARRVKSIDLNIELSGLINPEEVYIVVRDSKGRIICPQPQAASVAGEQMVYSAQVDRQEPSASPVTISRRLLLDRKLEAGSSVKVQIFGASAGLISSFELPLR